MTGEEYRTGLHQLGMTQLDFGKFIGVSPRTAQAYAAHGPTGPAAVVMAMLLWLSPPGRVMVMQAVRKRIDGSAKDQSDIRHVGRQ